MTCCLRAKYLLLLFNLIIWLSGGAFLSFGVFVLFKSDLHEFFALLSYDSQYLPSFQSIGYILIGLGVFIFIIGLTGCCGSVRESRLLLGFYVFFIIILMGSQLLLAIYSVRISHDWDTRIPKTLRDRMLSYNFSVPQQFEHDLDMIHKQFQCCGINGSSDFHKMKAKGSSRHLPLSCCTRLINNICHETDSYRIGCHEKIDKSIHYYTKLIVVIGIGFALVELAAIIFAVSECRYSTDDDYFD